MCEVLLAMFLTSVSVCLILSFQIRRNYGRSVIPSETHNEYREVSLHEVDEQGDGEERTISVDDGQGLKMVIHLSPSESMLAPDFRIFEINGSWSNQAVGTEDLLKNWRCHYKGDVENDPKSVAFFSGCDLSEMFGVILSGDFHYNIYPKVDSGHKAHFMETINVGEPGDKSEKENQAGDNTFKHFEKRQNAESRILELVVFADNVMLDVAKQRFPEKSESTGLVASLLYAIFNGVQSLYNNPTIDVHIRVVILGMYFINDDKTVKNGNGHAATYLENFCKFVNTLPRDGTTYPDHWDHAVMVTGTDVYHPTTDQMAASGLAYVGTTCNYPYACSVCEGRNDLRSDAFTIAHEMGHGMGIYHDGESNLFMGYSNTDCNANDYVMAGIPKPNRNGEWSKCSNRDLKKFLNRRTSNCLYNDPMRTSWANKVARYTDVLPGQRFNANEQCVIGKGIGYGVYEDQTFASLSNWNSIFKEFNFDFGSFGSAKNLQSQAKSICEELWCRKGNDAHKYLLGPAVDGTPCGDKPNHGCYNLQCVPLDSIPKSR